MERQKPTTPNRTEKLPGIEAITMQALLLRTLSSENGPVSHFTSPDFNILGQFGLNWQETLLAWRDSAEDSDNMTQLYTANLSSLYSLEKKRPGAARILQDRFKLRSLGKYPMELLIRQYDERDDPSKPYGIVIWSTFDSGGDGYQDIDTFQGLFKQVDRLGYSLRIYECDTRQDVVKALKTTKQKYGKAEFGIVNSHGGPDTMVELSGRNIKADDLRRKSALIARDAFVEKPTFILYGCETGFSKGPADELSAITEGTVIAPCKQTALNKIEARIDPNNKSRLDFRVSYSEPDCLMIYRNGWVFSWSGWSSGQI